jgi:C_GCAxxG_C_C family probable redox protein
MNAADEAASRFMTGCNCAQSVLAALAPACGVPAETALRLAAPFGGGIARTGATCGAVTGALMALGLRTGPFNPADPDAKTRIYALARDFLARFQACHGALTCRDLTGCDLTTPAGLKAFADCNLHTALCLPLVRSAVEILLETRTR